MVLNFITMDITWHGLSCFKFKGKDSVIITDPYREKTGLKLPNLKGDVVLISDEKSDYLDSSKVDEAVKVFDWPGEYEIKDIPIVGIDFSPKKVNGEKISPQRIIIFQFTMENIKFCFLGGLKNKLHSEVLEAIGDVDVLLVPVGDGTVVLDSKKAHEVIEQIDPAIVIPMYYKTDGVKLDLKTVDNFAKEVGLKSTEIKDSLKLKKSDIIEGKTDFVLLKAV